MVENRKAKTFSPLFSYFLSIKPFLVLYAAGFLVFVGWFHLTLTYGDLADIATSTLSLIIFSFLAPSVYVLVKKISKEFETLFNKSPSKGFVWRKRAGFPQIEEFANLFSKDAEFKRYKRNVLKMLNTKREKYFVIGIAFCILLPLLIFQDIQTTPIKQAFNGSLFPFNAIIYSSWIVYWTIIYTLLLSVVWMVITVTRALLNLEKEKPHLHVTQSILELHESFQHKETEAMRRAKIELLDLSFRRFKAGITPIVNFVFSLSLKIAFVGGFCSVPALAYFLITSRVVPVWYGLAAFSCLLSIAIFVVGQYGAWKLWSASKNNAEKLLNHICSDITKNLAESPRERSKDVDSIRKLLTDLSQMTSTTYTSSSIFKIVTTNFFAFGPVIIQQILQRFVLK